MPPRGGPGRPGTPLPCALGGCTPPGLVGRARLPATLFPRRRLGAEVGASLALVGGAGGPRRGGGSVCWVSALSLHARAPPGERPGRCYPREKEAAWGVGSTPGERRCRGPRCPAFGATSEALHAAVLLLCFLKLRSRGCGQMEVIRTQQQQREGEEEGEAGTSRNAGPQCQGCETTCAKKRQGPQTQRGSDQRRLALCLSAWPLTQSCLPHVSLVT